MLASRLRRWPNIDPTLGESLVLAVVAEIMAQMFFFGPAEIYKECTILVWLLVWQRYL